MVTRYAYIALALIQHFFVYIEMIDVHLLFVLFFVYLKTILATKRSCNYVCWGHLDKQKIAVGLETIKGYANKHRIFLLTPSMK